MPAEMAERVDFSGLRYAQCWEDADILLDALAIRPGQACLSIASGGDNTLAMLSRRPARVIAVDVNPAQLACLELKAAAYRVLEYGEVLELLGSARSRRREHLYRRCRGALSADTRRFWEARPDLIAGGVGGAGKFERYLAAFRAVILPLIHPAGRIARLVRGGPPAEREAFYHREWNTWRWRLLFQVFFSRLLLGYGGRDPALFRYVEGRVAARILDRTRYALTVLDPAENPYLQWILTGHHPTCLPCSLRPENFEVIRAHLDRLEWRCASLEDFMDACGDGEVDCCNLSNIFEYMPEDRAGRLLERLARVGRGGGRLAYWNLLVRRSRPARLADRLRPLTELARELHSRDKAFFYGAFIVEEIV